MVGLGGRSIGRQRPLANESGMAVVIALLILTVLSLWGITLMGLSLTESQIGSNESDLRKAFFAAEAGIQEAMYRMRLDPATSTDEGDTACSTAADPVVIGKQGAPAPSWADPNNANFWYYNPPTCAAWDYAYEGTPATGDGNFLGGTNKANLDNAGRWITSSGAAHGAGAALANANLGNNASYTVTVTPVVGYVGGCWQYVDQFGTPLPDSTCATAVTSPMYKVTSTGQAGSAQKTLSTMIHRMDLNPTPDGALTANTNINVQSAAAVIDGRNHDCDGNNPSDEGALQYAATSPTGAEGIDTNKPENLVCPNGTGDACKGTTSPFPDSIGALLLGFGPSPTPQQQAQIDALNAYLESLKIPPAQAPTSAFKGIVYIDGNYAKPPDGSEGILIVHHRDAQGQNGCTNPGGCDVANLGNFNEGTFKGVIIADKINKINGNAQIIGSVFGFGSAADGVTVDDVTGTPRIKYSKCILNSLENITNVPIRVVSGTWHEQ